MQRRIAPVHHVLAWDDARVLLAALRATSLVAAARALKIDKSTLSRRIDALEHALAVRLFVRTPEGLRPSPVGERLRAHAERMEAEMLSLTSTALAGGEEVSGRVRIATTEAMAARLVRAGLLESCARFPALELEILGGNRSLDLTRGEAELAIRVTPTSDPGLTVRVLGKFPISLFASPHYLRTFGSPRTVDQLAGHNVLVPSGELDALPEARWLRERPGVHFSLRSSSLPALVEAALCGHGLVPLTRAWGESVDGLEHVLEIDSIPLRPTWLVIHPDIAQQPAVRLVADTITELFSLLSRRGR